VRATDSTRACAFQLVAVSGIVDSAGQLLGQDVVEALLLLSLPHQGQMVRRPARVKASTRLSVKPLDAANGMMDSVGQQLETEHVDLEAKPPHPLQMVQQVGQTMGAL